MPGASRPQALIVGLAGCAAMLLLPARAGAWGFGEHTALGRDGYRDACGQLVDDLKLPAQLKTDQRAAICEKATDTATVRWCLACLTYSPTLYGQSVAIAGDHVGSPEELMSVQGQRVATNLTDYVFLALVNIEHFHPAAPRNWRTHHDRALEIATRDHATGSIARNFAEAFFASAFADHFLQDAFSAGHAGFNRAASGAAASMAFHDIWNRAGRVVKSPTGECWLQYGDGKLHKLSDFGRLQIETAEKASVLDVLAAFITGKRDSAREVRPVYHLPMEITPDPLPRSVWAVEDVEKSADYTGPIVYQMYTSQSARLDRSRNACTTVTVPIDGISNPANINAGLDFWIAGALDSQTQYASFDVRLNHFFFDVMSARFAWELGLGPAGYVHRAGRNAYAPSALGGILSPPLYLLHGLWRNEIGLQARSYLVVSDPVEFNGYASTFLRSSLEAKNTIFRFQVGPTVDFRSGRLGLEGSVGLELAQLRWITGGGSLGSP